MKQFSELEGRLAKAKADYQSAVDGLDKDLKVFVSTDPKLLRKSQHFQQQYACNPHTLKLVIAEQPGAAQDAPASDEPRGDQDPAPENS